MFDLMKLPYDLKGLEPYISSKTLELHHGKHHAGYVTNLNKLIKSTLFENSSLDDIVIKSSRSSEYTTIFNNAGQNWNHNIYWNCMKKNGGGNPTGKILDLLNRSFNTYDLFLNKFIDLGTKHFGSGWIWLVEKDNNLSIICTSNADNPLAHGMKAILGIDVWEHSYYIDYQNRRQEYLDNFFKHLINWEYINSRL